MLSDVLKLFQTVLTKKKERHFIVKGISDMHKVTNLNGPIIKNICNCEMLGY